MKNIVISSVLLSVVLMVSGCSDAKSNETKNVEVVKPKISNQELIEKLEKIIVDTKSDIVKLKKKFKNAKSEKERMKWNKYLKHNQDYLKEKKEELSKLK